MTCWWLFHQSVNKSASNPPKSYTFHNTQAILFLFKSTHSVPLTCLSQLILPCYFHTLYTCFLWFLFSLRTRTSALHPSRKSIQLSQWKQILVDLIDSLWVWSNSVDFVNIFMDSNHTFHVLGYSPGAFSIYYWSITILKIFQVHILCLCKPPCYFLGVFVKWGCLPFMLSRRIVYSIKRTNDEWPWNYHLIGPRNRSPNWLGICRKTENGNSRCWVSEALGPFVRLGGAEKVKEAPGSPVLVRDRQGWSTTKRLRLDI